MNILFVCTGNTCRSPMAAVLFDKIATDRQLDVRIESAGLCANTGDCATNEAVLAMKNYGIDLSAHRAQAISRELIDQSDLILTMTNSHKLALEPIAPDKVFTICEFAGVAADIADPFGGDAHTYEKCAAQIYDTLIMCADRIESDDNE